MYSHHEAEERKRAAEYARRKYGNIEFGNATEAMAHLAAEGQEMMQRLPSGVPLSIQDLGGNIAYIAGIHGPVNPNAGS